MIAGPFANEIGLNRLSHGAASSWVLNQDGVFRRTAGPQSQSEHETRAWVLSSALRQLNAIATPFAAFRYCGKKFWPSSLGRLRQSAGYCARLFNAGVRLNARPASVTRANGRNHVMAASLWDRCRAVLFAAENSVGDNYVWWFAGSMPYRSAAFSK